MVEYENMEEMLVEFISSFNASLDPRLWLKLIKEEHGELLFELAQVPMDKAKVLKEFSDLLYVATGFRMVFPENFNLVSKEERIEIGKLLDDCLATVEKAIPMFSDEAGSEAIIRVHKSNMSKLGDDGKPILREDGKVLKGPNYKPAILDDLIEE